jgi:hypothetical protein
VSHPVQAPDIGNSERACVCVIQRQLGKTVTANLAHKLRQLLQQHPQLS